ncbi:MAG: hypothetical protein MZV64_49775 [Ignavibacteriales bacterium]|nr:hypothetical protein [Ignavibacteriales bacterium]
MSIGDNTSGEPVRPLVPQLNGGRPGDGGGPGLHGPGLRAQHLHLRQLPGRHRAQPVALRPRVAAARARPEDARGLPLPGRLPVVRRGDQRERQGRQEGRPGPPPGPARPRRPALPPHQLRGVKPTFHHFLKFLSGTRIRPSDAGRRTQTIFAESDGK